MVIGPFQIKKGEDFDKIDYLERVNLSESIASVDEFSKKLKAIGVPDGEGTIYPKWFVMNERRHFVDFNHAFNQPESKETDGMVAYVAFNVTSTKKTNAWMLIGSTGVSRVFANGKRVFAPKGRRSLFIYRDLTKVPIAPGDNLVVVKIPRQDTLWGFCAHLSLAGVKTAQATLAAQSSLEKSIMRKNIYYTFDEPVAAAPRGAPFSVKFTGHVRSITGERTGGLVGNKVQWDKATAQSGLHKVVLEVNGKEYYERLLVGHPAHALQDALLEIDALPFRLQEHGGFAALKARLGFLASQFEKNNAGKGENPDPIGGGRGWERRFVHELWITQEALMRVRRGEEPFSHVTGLHLNGFVSRIDDSQQCYRIYVPSCYKKDASALPLVVILPTAVSAAKPFLESPFLDDHHLADRMAKLAERHGVILLWSGYHNRPTGLPMESAHLAEVLEAVGRNYLFDRNRVTLMGMCSAAPLAFDACASWPGRFAGIAVLNPEFVLDQNMPRNLVAAFSKRKEFREWFMRGDRMSAFLKRKTPDVFIINDGGNEPGHGDLKTSKAFVTKAVRAGAPVRFETPPRRESAHLGAWEDLIEWAAQQRGGISWEDGAERVRRGSVQDVLTEKFWVVIGSTGNDEENAANATVAEAIQAGWRKTHFSGCRMVMDSELAAEEMRNSNLVLIGNARTNSVWRELDRGLGVTITGDGITWGERSWFGDGIAIQAVMRHPKNPARRIVVVGGLNLSPESFGTLNLSRDGWFRYAVWGGGDDGPELRDASL
ncbi:hypothetical protein AW736_04375 [Termitidicoccus mucosus]|uniref:Peptidase S9 prolyl oligopeptidase catalytic domain-containing protein n=1 Tax=Termitidicoccus mucosus TaxID=1184151 RepID=A0A178IQ13_9BACT|nr:hypothetical protein AW736_04375 [Opitutaceae bacterium TSB47]